MKLFLSLLMVIGAVIGIVDSGYLTYEKVSGRVPPCNASFKCGAVLDSPWASIGPVPVSVMGIFFYLAFLGMAALQLGEKEFIYVRQWKVSVSAILLTLGLSGVIASTVFVYLMAVVIQAWCLYCLISALNCVVLGATSSFNFYRSLTKGW